MAFQGFSKKAVQYLHDVYQNNSKAWYETHKKDFEMYLKEPFYEMILELTPQMKKIDPDFILEPKRCLARIYRDVRFSRDGSLYRNRLWLTFKRPAENWLEIPAFFFELTESDWSYGMGYYTAKASDMADFRDYISQNPKSFQAAVRPIAESDSLRIHGETYKKEKPGAPAGLEDWFRLKNFYVGAVSPLQQAMSPGIVKTVSSAFDKMKELYRVLAFDIPEMKAEKQNEWY